MSRQEQDEFALKSQQKCAIAKEAGSFKQEIVPVPVKTRAGNVIFAKILGRSS